MAQIDFNGTDGNDLLDASGLGAGNWAVLRGKGGSDTLIGSSGADRFDGGAGADSMSGGAGDDKFFIAVNNTPGGPRDSIDGGAGADQIIITMNNSQLSAAYKAELLRLNDYLTTGDFSSHFISDVLHLDVTDVDTALVKLDGQNKTIVEALQPVPVTLEFSIERGTSIELNGNPWVEDGFTFTYDPQGTGWSTGINNLGFGPDGGFLYFRGPTTVLTKNDGTDFDLNSFIASTDGTTLIEGYNNGVKIYSQYLDDTDLAWTARTLNWSGVDEVHFSNSGIGGWFGIGNLVLV